MTAPHAHAATLPRAAAQTDPGLRYTSDMLIAVLDDATGVGAVCQALRGIDVDAGRIETLRGALPTPRRSRARRLFGALGSDHELTLGHARELADGHTLVIVRDLRRGDAPAARDALVAHGAHGVQHFGRFTVALLAP